MDKQGLLKTIKIKGLSVPEVCKGLNIDDSTFYRKLNGVSDFTRGEMLLMQNILGISFDEMMAIFFGTQSA